VVPDTSFPLAHSFIRTGSEKRAKLMSLGYMLSRSLPGAWEMDGSDGSDPSATSRFEYLEDARVHLEAARQALQNMMYINTTDAPESGLEAVYAGCVRELESVGLQLGIGGARGEAKCYDSYSADNTLAGTAVPAAEPNTSHSRTDINSHSHSHTYQSNPGYSFAVHFFPQERYADWRDRPTVSALTDAIHDAFQRNPATAHIQRLADHLSWRRGTLVLSIPPGSMGMEDLVKEIDFVGIVKRMTPIHPVEEWSCYRLHGTRSCFLRIHDIGHRIVALGDWEGLGPLIKSIDGNTEYSLPTDFRITGVAVSVKSPSADGSGGSWDAVIDLGGLDNQTLERLFDACEQEIPFILEMGDFSSISTHTSFIELQDGRGMEVIEGVQDYANFFMMNMSVRS